MGEQQRVEQNQQAAVRVSELRKEYDTTDGKITALDQVSFSIEPGTVVGILGPNGAGKTTLIKSILDLVRPTSGEITVFGTDVHDSGNELYQQTSAMLEGARNIYWRLSLRENLYYFTSLQGIDPAIVEEENLEIVDSLELTDKLDEPVNSLSRGMKQKASLACTLARRTELVFLDEPTLGLDVESSITLRKTLREMVTQDEKTVILTSHDMDVIEELCDRVIVLNEGEIIVDDSVTSLLDAFKTQAHRIRVDEKLNAEDRTAIEQQCETTEWTTTGDFFELTATLEQPSDYYQLISRLESAGATIRMTETISPDLEDVFLRVTHDGEEQTDKVVDSTDKQTEHFIKNER